MFVHVQETRLMFQVLVKYVLQVTVVERDGYGDVMPVYERLCYRSM